MNYSSIDGVEGALMVLVDFGFGLKNITLAYIVIVCYFLCRLQLVSSLTDLT